jgi:cytochrome P450
MLAERQKLRTSRKDIFKHLLAEDSETGGGFTQDQLNANANFMILAGADMTSTTTTQIMRALCKDRRVLSRL